MFDGKYLYIYIYISNRSEDKYQRVMIVSIELNKSSTIFDSQNLVSGETVYGIDKTGYWVYVVCYGRPKSVTESEYIII